MKFEEIQKVLSHEDTIFTQQGGYNMAVNTQEGKFVKESGDVYVVGNLKTNDISDLGNEAPTELYNLQQAGDLLGMTRSGIRWHLDNKDYSKVPKPMYVNETKRGNTYFWLPEQFKQKK